MTRKKFRRRIYIGILKAQKLICACGCGVKMNRGEGFEFDHTTALALGGADLPDNLRALRKPCHKAVSAKDIKMISKADRLRKRLNRKQRAFKKRIKSRGFDKRYRKRMDGTVEARR